MVDGAQHLGQCRLPRQRLVALGTVFVEPLLRLRVGALEISGRVSNISVMRRSINRTSPETRMCGMIPLVEAARRSRSSKLPSTKISLCAWSASGSAAKRAAPPSAADRTAPQDDGPTGTQALASGGPAEPYLSALENVSTQGPHNPALPLSRVSRQHGIPGSGGGLSLCGVGEPEQVRPKQGDQG